MGTNESFDVQNMSLLICLLLLLTNVRTVSDLSKKLIICGVPHVTCHMCAFELFTANMTQYNKGDSPIGNPKTHHTMHITAETCFVTGI